MWRFQLVKTLLLESEFLRIGSSLDVIFIYGQADSSIYILYSTSVSFSQHQSAGPWEQPSEPAFIQTALPCPPCDVPIPV